MAEGYSNAEKYCLIQIIRSQEKLTKMSLPASIYTILKRPFDCMFAAVLCVLIAPIFISVYLLIVLLMGRPAIFKQIRAGYKGTPFTIYKFRTMKSLPKGSDSLSSDEARLTKFGRFLRSTSLDEIPQLLNVLKGEMSFVGPRPLYMKYIPLYSKQQVRRLEVLPGITGWSQVNGRNAINWKTKLELDVWYVDHRSLLLDLKIILLTLKKTIAREGITQKDSATVDEFTGSN